MTVTLENVDFQFFEALKGIVGLRSDVKITKYEDDGAAQGDFHAALNKWHEGSFMDDVEIWRNEFDVRDDNVADFLENVHSTETPNIQKIENIWK